MYQLNLTVGTAAGRRMLGPVRSRTRWTVSGLAVQAVIPRAARPRYPPRHRSQNGQTCASAVRTPADNRLPAAAAAAMMLARRRWPRAGNRRHPMASEELATVHELLRGFDLEDLTIAERRAAMTSAAAPAPPGTTVEPVDAGGVPAEWVVAAGVDSVHVPLYLHGGAYQVGAPAMLRRMIALISAAARFLLTGGADPAAIAIAGDSSGGGLALTTLVALRDAGYPRGGGRDVTLDGPGADR
jgi:acetyl esterase/lipase